MVFVGADAAWAGQLDTVVVDGWAPHCSCYWAPVATHRPSYHNHHTLAGTETTAVDKYHQ